MFCIALMVTFDLFKLTYRMTWVKKRRQTTRQLWHFTDENQGAKKFEKRNLAHFHTWAWFHIFVYFSKKMLEEKVNLFVKWRHKFQKHSLLFTNKNLFPHRLDYSGWFKNNNMSNQIANQKVFNFWFSYLQSERLVLHFHLQLTFI